MAHYAPPSGLSLNDAIHTIFSHYAGGYKSSLGHVVASEDDPMALGIDGPNFAKMCREAPGLAKVIGRTDVDVIFSSSKSSGIRRLDYENFLKALLHLAVHIFPDEEPTNAMANFLSQYIFALFDQPPGRAEKERRTLLRF